MALGFAGGLREVTRGADGAQVVGCVRAAGGLRDDVVDLGGYGRLAFLAHAVVAAQDEAAQSFPCRSVPAFMARLAAFVRPLAIGCIAFVLAAVRTGADCGSAAGVTAC